jgi:hypothetical protein
MIGMAYMAFIWVWSRLPWQPEDAAVHLHDRPALIFSAMLVFFGTNLVAMGFVAELVASLVSRDHDEFSVAEYTTPGRTAHVERRTRQQDAP